MEELLQTIVEQNERMITVVETIESEISEMKDGICSMHDELQWHKDLSAIAQVIKGIEAVEDAVRAQG